MEEVPEPEYRQRPRATGVTKMSVKDGKFFYESGAS